MATYADFIKDALFKRNMNYRDIPEASATCTVGATPPTYTWAETSYRRRVSYHAARPGRKWK